LVNVYLGCSKSNKIDQNRSKSIKIDQNRSKSIKNRSKSIKIDQNCWFMLISVEQCHLMLSTAIQILTKSANLDKCCSTWIKRWAFRIRNISDLIFSVMFKIFKVDQLFILLCISPRPLTCSNYT
jgi:hypothetical protein